MKRSKLLLAFLLFLSFISKSAAEYKSSIFYGTTIYSNKQLFSRSNLNQSSNVHVLESIVTKEINNDLNLGISYNKRLAQTNTSKETLNPNTTYNTQKIYSDTVLLVGHYYLNSNKFIRPYIIFGTGISFNTLQYNALTHNSLIRREYQKNIKKSFAWQVGVGGEYQYNKRLFLDANLKFLDRGKFEVSKNKYINGNVEQVHFYPRHKCKIRDILIMGGVTLKI